MAIYVSNIVIEQGYSFNATFQLEDNRTNQPLVLINASIDAKLKKTYTSSSSVSFASTVSIPEKGTVSISLTSDQTNLLKPGRYVYDVKIFYPNNKKYKAVEGAALVRPGVTI